MSFKEFCERNNFDPLTQRFVHIVHRTPSGRYKNEDILIVDAIAAMDLKMKYLDDFSDITYLLEDEK
jgi:hypothetical protein